MKIASLVESYSDFIQAATLSRALRQKHGEVLVYSGPHTEYFQARAYFEHLDLPQPQVNLDLKTSDRLPPLGELVTRLERTLLDLRPDLIVIRGRSTTALAGALTAARQTIPLAHLDAGVRTYDKRLPEEVTGMLSDRLADVLFCSTRAAIQRLAEEGIVSQVYFSGDILLDVVEQHLPAAQLHSSILQRVGLYPGYYLLAVVRHVRSPQQQAYLGGVVKALNSIREPIIFPMTIQTQTLLDQLGLTLAPHVLPIDSISYLDLLNLERHARAILTDLDSLQREAYCLAVPCITLRDTTDVHETVEAGWNCLVGGDTDHIIEAVRDFLPPLEHPPVFGDGHAAEQIAQVLDAQPVVFGQSYDRAAMTLEPRLLIG